MTVPPHGPIPAYPCKARVAYELDMSESTVDDMVKRGILPPPSALSTGCVRFCWEEIQATLALKKKGAASRTATKAPPADAYDAGTDNVLKISEGRRDAS